QLVRSSFAEQGEYVDDVVRPYWRLTNVNETRFTTDRVFARQHDVYEWQVDMSPELLSVLLVRPDRQSISGLYQFARYFDREGLDSSSYYLAFWKKLLQPLATMSLVLLAVSFVFGPLREATMGYRVFVAIAMGLGFTILQRTMGPATILYGISPFVATLMPIVVCAGIGIYLLRRV
ncbi:MAG TPA: LptF/LptG family permease, partial [Pseudohongiella sp.]|nr:LptF/LptG family permease [Pseudohongiella sp.]